MLLSLSFFWIIKLNVLDDATTKTKLSNCIELIMKTGVRLINSKK